jgi:DNA-binding transcriptional MocR family regulator
MLGAQASVTALLHDTAFVTAFLAENRRRMAAAYSGLAAAADAAEIPYTPAAAAMFLWIDLRRELRAPEWAEERALWQQLVDCGVVLTPGAAAPHGLAPRAWPVHAALLTPPLRI